MSFVPDSVRYYHLARKSRSTWEDIPKPPHLIIRLHFLMQTKKKKVEIIIVRLAHEDFLYPKTLEIKYIISHYTSKWKPGSIILIPLVATL